MWTIPFISKGSTNKWVAYQQHQYTKPPFFLTIDLSPATREGPFELADPKGVCRAPKTPGPGSQTGRGYKKAPRRSREPESVGATANDDTLGSWLYRGNGARVEGLNADPTVGFRSLCTNFGRGWGAQSL
ncbi:hypothetical protein JTE90_006731 [Oedothorax gibbosus]|uniref:Uncharacterized protein n=1 Tax=Oedothorax gibbosus TaxID=931172 RepID=A0AAV6U8T8_9ARAC|nr:hypothetical protein JTE90_006731 [Oedothorax gibbosus]